MSNQVRCSSLRRSEGIMKRRRIALVILGTIVLALGGTASMARADQLIQANVPFPFMVGDVRLPSGDYVVTGESSGNVLLIASADHRQAVFTLTIPASSKESPSH